MKLFKEYKYIWNVCGTSRDDGTTNIYARFTKQSDATAWCNAPGAPLNASVSQGTLWQDENGDFYELSARKVLVDVSIHRSTGLAKLTTHEKKALGLSG